MTDLSGRCGACQSVCEECATAAERDRLREALREAIEFADEGWAYAFDYFREKWEYEDRRTRLLAVLDPEAAAGGRNR